VKEAWSAIGCRANPRALRGSQPSRIPATGGVPVVPVGTLASGLPTDPDCVPHKHHGIRPVRRFHHGRRPSHFNANLRAQCLGLAVLKLRGGWVLFERRKLSPRPYNRVGPGLGALR
jgi:hypothetical protein